MDANQLILSVLTKMDLFYLKKRYLQMRENTRAVTGCRSEREHLPFVILSLAEYCSSIKLLFLVAIISITANAVFHDEVLKSLIIAGITLILSILVFLYAEVRLTRFPSMLVFKMLLIRVKCLKYNIPVPKRLPDDWEIYPI